MFAARHFRALCVVPAALSLVAMTVRAQILTREKYILAFPAPSNVTTTGSTYGVQVGWTGVAEAVQYQVLRGPDATTPGTVVATLPGGSTGYLDKGFNAAAGYQVVAFAADGRQGKSAIVLYSPFTMTTLGPIIPLLSIAKPVISSISPLTSGVTAAHIGDVITVTGSALDGTISVMLQEANCNYTPCRLTAGYAQYTVTPVNRTATSFQFSAPQVPVGINNTSATYLLVVTRSGYADTSDTKLYINNPPPVRNYTSVNRTIVLAGSRLDVTGVGMDVTAGAYFGSGIPGSTANPLLNIWNRSATWLQVEVPAGCNMQGQLMLKTDGTRDAGMDLILGSPSNITITCVPGLPAGVLQGATFTQPIYAQAGATLVISGSSLQAVTRVLDQNNLEYPILYKSPTALNVRVPSTITPGLAYGLRLDHNLTNPALAQTVTGNFLVPAAPTWYRISPAWAEAGQLVTINGHNLKTTTMPVVTVGGVPAQVTSAEPLTVRFRLAAGTVAGPITIQTEGGSVQAAGPFTTGMGTSHPGFFVVSGPSSVTQVVQPRTTLAYGDTIVVRGQNLARLNGLCVLGAAIGTNPSPGYVVLRRLPIGQGLGYETSNTEMRVAFDYQPYFIASGIVQLHAPNVPAGDYPPTSFTCAPNPAGIQWP